MSTTTSPRCSARSTSRCLERDRPGACRPRLPALLHVDTGMARLGLTPRRARGAGRSDHDRLAGHRPALCDDASGLRPKFRTTRSTSASAAASPPPAPRCRPAPRSFANSSGIFLGAGFASDLARPGAALYGINPTPGPAQPDARGRCAAARVLQVRDVPSRRRPVGYNATWPAARPSRIATAGDRLRRRLAPQPVRPAGRAL